MPDGAQMSPDGNYWWDEANQQWQLVDNQGGGTGAGGSGGSGGGGGGQGAAAFAFNEPAQLGVSDENDGPMPTANNQTKVSFGAVWNIGTVAGTPTVHVLVDDNEVQTWSPPQDIQPQQSAQPDDGFVHNCGTYPVGRHRFVARLDNTADGHPSEVSNEVDLNDA
jgi:hypothetical protein